MLFGLTCDFIQRDGICMVLDESDGLSADKLNRIQTRMMMHTRIPNHLRLYLKEIDLKLSLEYTVSGKKMLSHLLKSEKLTMNAFFGLLLQVAQGMEEGRLYMLDPGMYALHEDYIFIEGALLNGKVYLTYIPLDNPADPVKPGERMRSLIMVLMASITELRGNGVQRLLQYCGEEGFSSGGLKALLAGLLTEGVDSNKLDRISEDERVSPRPERPRIPLIPEEELPENKRQTPGWTSGYTTFNRVENDRGMNNADSTDSEIIQTSGSKTYIILGCLLADALLWKFVYLNNSNTLTFMVCGVLSIILATLSILAWKSLIRLGGRKNDNDEEADIKAGMAGLSPEESRHSFGRPSLPNLRPSAIDLDHRAATQSNVRLTDFMADVQEITHSPVSIAPTALLSREKNPVTEQGLGKRQNEAPYLERQDEEGDGVRERIDLNRPSFIIGRSTEVAQYIESSEGASRVHAEISRSTGGYLLKDLNSRNGTFFQGEPMIPYKEYPLAEGDVFTIVKGKYTFRTA